VNCQHGVSISLSCHECAQITGPLAALPVRACEDVSPGILCMVSMTGDQLDRALQEFHEATTTPYERVLQEACERLYRMVCDHAPGFESAARDVLVKALRGGG
jgi:hypothetical protein